MLQSKSVTRESAKGDNLWLFKMYQKVIFYKLLIRLANTVIFLIIVFCSLIFTIFTLELIFEQQSGF